MRPDPRLLVVLPILAALACSDVAPLPPEVVNFPATVYQSQPVQFRLTTRTPEGTPLVFLCDWGDGITDTSQVFGSGDTAAVGHAWAAPGAYQVSFRAALAHRPAALSGATDPPAITVLANGVPQSPALEPPARAVPGAWALFRATATDPDGDSVGVLLDFGGTVGLWTGFAASGEAVRDSHQFALTGTVLVRAKARDARGSESGWSEPKTLVVGEAGAVRWQFSADGLPDYCAPLVVRVGSEEVVFVAGESLYAVGSKVRAVGTGPGQAFTAFPAWCEQTGHVIVGRDDGSLLAFTPSLVEAWSIQPDSGRMADISAPAVNGNRLYVLSDARLWCLLDLGTEVSVVGYRDDSLLESVAPAVCPDGGVVVSRNGTVLKLGPDLDTLLWAAPTGDFELAAIAIGSSGEVYYAGWDGEYGAISAGGTSLWSERVSTSMTGIAVGRDRVFFTTEMAEVLCHDLAGSHAWNITVPTQGAVGAPVLAANGLLYLAEDEGLWCLRQSDGGVEWFCPLGNRLRNAATEPDIYAATLNARGDIIVNLDGILYCVAGYAAGTLDPDAPWPKWQHDAHNTGRAGGR